MTRHMVIYEPTAPPPAWFFPALAAATPSGATVEPVSVADRNGESTETILKHLTASASEENGVTVHAFPGRPGILAYKFFRRTGIPWVAHQTVPQLGPLKIRPIAAGAARRVAYGAAAAQSMAEWGVLADATWSPDNPPAQDAIRRLLELDNAGRTRGPASPRPVSCLVLTEIDPFAGLNQRTHHLIDYLSQVFDRVTVLCVNTRVPVQQHHLAVLSQDDPDPLDLHHTVLRRDNVEYLGIPALFAEVARRLNLNLLSWYRILLVMMDRYARTLLGGRVFDLCFAHGPKPGYVATRLKEIGLVDFIIYEDLDDFAGFYEDHPSVRDEANLYEIKALEGSDLVVPISQGLAEFHSRIATIRSCHVVPNGTHYDLFAPAQARPRLEPILIYTGSIEVWAGLDLAIEAMDILRRRLPAARLFILGSGVDTPNILDMIKTRGLEQTVVYLGRVPYEKLPMYLRQARAGIIPFRQARLTELAFPLKIVEYMSAGLPVLAMDYGEMARLLADTRGGLAAKTAEDLADKAFTLLTDDRVHQTLAENAIQAARHYDWSVLFNDEVQAIARALCLENDDIGRLWDRREGDRQPTPAQEVAATVASPPSDPASARASDSPFTFVIPAGADPAPVVQQAVIFMQTFHTGEPVALMISVGDEAYAHAIYRHLEDMIHRNGLDPDQIPDIEILVHGSPEEALGNGDCLICLSPGDDDDKDILCRAVEMGLCVTFFPTVGTTLRKALTSHLTHTSPATPATTGSKKDQAQDSVQ